MVPQRSYHVQRERLVDHVQALAESWNVNEDCHQPLVTYRWQHFQGKRPDAHAQSLVVQPRSWNAAAESQSLVPQWS